MKRPFIRAAQRCYRALPSLRLRQIAFGTFARLVRRRRTIVSLDGMVFDLDLSEFIDLSLYLEQYEAEVTRAIRRITRPGMTIVDLGANIGAHTLLFAKLAGRTGRVVAFEPADFAFPKLQRNLSLNDFPQVRAVKLALADVESAEQRVDLRSSWQTDGTRQDRVSTLAFARLDDWAEANRLERIDVVKIDVDGNEFPLLDGGRRTIGRNTPIMLMEAVGPHFDDESRNPFALLREIGYRFWDLKSLQELTVEQMRDRLPRNDTKMTTSFNLMAALELPE